jgi:BlaI family transcriptional regulator, penicillinase repressor
LNKAPRISDAEWEVMNVVWANPPITASEVVDALARPTGWNPRTIKTMLNRLVKKGVLGFEQHGKAYLYKPLVRRAECVRRESRSFLERVFDGAAGSLLVHFAENTELSREEIRRLKSILARREK